MNKDSREAKIYNKRKLQFCSAVDGGHVTARDIAEQAKLTHSHIFNLAASLQADGLISKEYKYVDGSHQAHAIFSLTDAGREIARQPIAKDDEIESANDSQAAFCQAIMEGHRTNEQLMEALGFSRNYICQMGLTLERSGLITRAMVNPERNFEAAITHSAGRTRTTYSLTESGAALAAKAPFINASHRRVNAPSIRDLCNGRDYRRWLQDMKQLAKKQSACQSAKS